MKVIPGKLIASRILENISSALTELPSSRKGPNLTIIQVGNDVATNIYVKHKYSDALKVGIGCNVQKFESGDLEKLKALIEELNNSDKCDGYIIQLPLPAESNIRKLLSLIDPTKDVDGLSPKNLGRLWQGELNDVYLPATVLAILECIRYTSFRSIEQFESARIDTCELLNSMPAYLNGKEVLIINDSVIVGRPLAGVLLNMGASPIINHKFSRNIGHHLRNADIVVSATGKGGLIDLSLVKENAIVIDVGIRNDQNQIRGDVQIDIDQDFPIWVSPVPGGVGPVTRAKLLENTYNAYTNRLKVT